MEIMDLIPWTPVAVSLLIISFTLIYLIISLFATMKTTTGTNGFQTPPGRTGLPLIGETLHLHFNGKKGVPERFVLDRIKKYSSKVFKTSLLGQQVVILGSPEGHKFLFSNENKLVKTTWPRHLQKIFPVGSSEDQDETSLRLHKTLLPYFKPDALQRYVPIMDSMTKQHLLKHWDGKDVVPVHALTKVNTFNVACRLLLGIEDEETVERLKKPFNQIGLAVLSLPLNFPGTRFYRGVKATELFVKEIDGLIRQWKSDFSEGRLSCSGLVLDDVLRQAFDVDDTVTLSGHILGSLVGSYETTSATFAGTILYMAKHPHVYDKVLAEQQEIARSKGPQEMLNWEDIQRMKYSWNVVCEFLRRHPPITGSFREAISDLTFEGFSIPKGSKMRWDPYSTHMNPEYYENPEMFDPSRFEGDGPRQYTYIPFGGGPRICPGREYARIKILVFMHNVVTKFRWEMVFPYEKITCDPIIQPTKGVPIRLYPHI